MILTFIQAANGTPLVKNLITGESYPNVVEVNSFEFDGEGLDYLKAALEANAANGNAMLTGKLDRKLIGESRAGHCSPTPTTVFIVDVDSNDLKYPSRRAFMDSLGLTADFVFQHSASSTSNESLRGHYFFLLQEEASCGVIKDYLKHLNITHLKDRLQLSGSKIALKWPLDIAVNDAGRIIYIAPPIQESDPISERIVFEPGTERTVTIPEYTAVNPVEIVNKLRSGEKLEPRIVNNAEIVHLNPNEVKITGIKENRGYVYLNLNGGDSWGYFFPENNPAVVNNFKGEPRFYLHSVDQDMYNEYIAKRTAPVQPTQPSNAPVPEVFKDFDTDRYYQVVYDPTNGTVLRYAEAGSKDKLRDFLIGNGVIPPKQLNVKDGYVFFDPSNTTQYDPIDRKLNTFRSTPYLEITATTDVVPTYIDRVIRHITVTEEHYHYFLNWLAYIYQERKKTGTAWLFHGHTGTGKGTLFHEVITPIFGANQCHACNTSNTFDTHNGFMATNLFTLIDEFNINDVNTGGRSWNKLKNEISEPRVTVRKMRSDQISMPNFSNFFLYTNENVAIRIDRTERRLNIPPKQPKPLPNLAKFRPLIKHELEAFSQFLRGYQVDESKVHTPIESEARDLMIKNSRSSVDEFFAAVQEGDLDFFIDFANPKISDLILAQDYNAVLKDWIDGSNTPNSYITDYELFVAYKTIIEPKSLTQLKFRAICKNKGLEFKSVRVHSSPRQYRLPNLFQATDVELSEKTKPNNVIPIK